MHIPKFTRTAVALSAALIASGAFAQASTSEDSLTLKAGPNALTLFGLIDVTLSHRNNTNKAGNKQTGFQEAWFSGNRWGLTGTHDLKDGAQAIFRVESEFNYRDGTNSDSALTFNRDAWLGLQSDTLGKLTFGRQNTLARDFSQNYGDPYGTAQVTLNEGGWSNNNNFKHLIFYAGSATGTRYNDGMVWKKKMGDWVAGLGYQFGGVSGDNNRGTTKAAALAYNGSNYNVSGFYNTANVAGLQYNSYSLGGNVQVNSLVRLNAGVFKYSAGQVNNANGNRNDTAYTLSAKFTPPGKFDYEIGYQSMHVDHAVTNPSGYVYNAFADASAATGLTATGHRNTTYGSIFYRYDKSTDLYLAADKLKTTGSYLAAQANGYQAQTEVAVGLRFRF